MKYFSLDCVSKAYSNFQGNMTNKSWGLLCIMKQLDSTILQGRTYKFNCSELSNYIERLFCLSNEKKNYVDTGKLWYIKFSTQWHTFFLKQGRNLPNIFDLIIWAYRKEQMPDDVTDDYLVAKFVKDFNLSSDTVANIFDIEKREISYDNSLYSDSDLLTSISNGENDLGINITAEKKSVTAAVGELSRGPFIQPLYAALDTTDYFLISQVNFDEMYPFNKKEYKDTFNKNLQQIYYGAPGTGKSHTIKDQTAEANKSGHVIRTTFHPDSDYSTFVGCYKPTTIEVPMRDVTGKVIRENGEDVTETRIVYEFVRQAFLEAYINAWKLYADAKEGDQPQHQYLIIEEINRGNCAQIFGDLFQLLDRNPMGFSDYPIKADNDMRKQLEKAFKGLSIAGKEEINDLFDGKDVVAKVLNGEELLLPNNLYIWATMNTSDQSLFPIDSAFKRRWDWKYVPISNAGKNWRIEVNGKQYDWWDFLEKINEKIGEATHSEDKKLGYFFCKADEEGIISAEKFVDKVIFYLWNDVFKDFIEEGDNIFKGSDESKPSFNKFYTVGMDDDTMVVEKEISQFMTNLNLHPINDTSKIASDGNGNEDGDDEDNDDEDDDSTNSTDQKKRDKSKFSINQNGEFVKKHVPFEAVSIYVKNHPDSTAQDIVDAWKKLNARVTFVISSDDYETKSKESKDGNFENRYDAINLQNGEKIYVCNQVSFRSINDLMSKVNAQDWGIKIEKIDEQA